jgi:hypothetical protein
VEYHTPLDAGRWKPSKGGSATHRTCLGRTFAIDQQSIRPRVTWQPNTSFRAIALPSRYREANRSEVRRRNGISDLGMELRYNTAGKGSLLATANLVGIDYDGEVNSPLGNELLKA